MSFAETLDNLALTKSALVQRFEDLISPKSDHELEAMAQASRSKSMKSSLKRSISPDRDFARFFLSQVNIQSLSAAITWLNACARSSRLFRQSRLKWVQWRRRIMCGLSRPGRKGSSFIRRPT